jgi:hypothetical protein
MYVCMYMRFVFLWQRETWGVNLIAKALRSFPFSHGQA